MSLLTFSICSIILYFSSAPQINCRPQYYNVIDQHQPQPHLQQIQQVHHQFQYQPQPQIQTADHSTVIENKPNFFFTTNNGNTVNNGAYQTIENVQMAHHGQFPIQQYGQYPFGHHFQTFVQTPPQAQHQQQQYSFLHHQSLVFIPSQNFQIPIPATEPSQSQIPQSDQTFDNDNDAIVVDAAERSDTDVDIVESEDKPQDVVVLDTEEETVPKNDEIVHADAPVTTLEKEEDETAEDETPLEINISNTQEDENAHKVNLDEPSSDDELNKDKTHDNPDSYDEFNTTDQ